MDAVLCFNDGALGNVRVLESLCGKAGSNCVVGLIKQDSTRLRKAELAYKEVEKEQEKQKRQPKKGYKM